VSSEKKLYRAGKGHVLGGVCAGIADYLSIDVIIVRAIWLVLTLVHGIGAVAYVVCLVLVPKNPLHEQLPVSEQKKDSNYGLYIGLALVIIGLSVVFHRWFNFFFWDLDWLFFTFHWKIVWPVLFILLGVWFILRASKTAEDDKPSETFYRSPDKRMISGVCGGLSELWNVDVTLVRVGYALATLFTAVWLGIITYVVLAVVIKERDMVPEAEVVEPEEKKQAPKRKRTPRKKVSKEESPKAEPEQTEENQNKGETDEQK
jgi:phage shock protein C